MADDAPITGEIAVENLGAVMAGLKQFQGGIRTKLRERLTDVAEQAASYAVWIAREKGLHESGELIDQIKAGWRTSYAYITDTARRSSPAYPGGFNYPAIYEYGGSTTRGSQWSTGSKIRNRSAIGTRLIAQHGIGEGHVGPRAFLYPAAVEGEARLVPAVQHALELLAADCGLQLA
jgi:hypothetical protein